MINLSNQVALITGGSRGIGAATAFLLARAGADIVIMYRNDAASASNVLNQIQKTGRNGLIVKGNVEKETDCKKVIVKTMKEFGKINILVNNAGIWEYGKVGKMSLKDWRRTIAANLDGTFNMCSAVIPVMKRQQYGRIINVSSTAGQRGEAFHSHYAASKGGMIAFTKSLAVEVVKNGIWVNNVAPGWVDTDMVSKVFRNFKMKKEIDLSIPRGKPASPDEIAGPILFLCSQLSNHIVGETININGGSVL